MDCVTAPPGIQVFPVGLLEIKVTLPPAHNEVDPTAEIVGVAGKGLTVTTIGVEVAEQVPLFTVTV